MPLRAARYDPTRTGFLYRSFAVKLRRIFRQIARDVRELLVKDDAFGLVENAFCPTGPGGGQDNSCGPKESGVRAYVDFGEGINAALRSGRKLDELDREVDFDLKETVAAIDRSMVESKEEKRVFRGANAARIPKEGETFTDLGYASASRRRDIAAKFQKKDEGQAANITIIVPKGHKHLEIDSLEHETLLPRGTKFLVESKKPTITGVRVTLRVVSNALVANAQFSFQSDPDKLVSFQRWLRTRLDDVKGVRQKELWEQYVEQGFHKGATRSFDDVVRTKPSPEVREALGARNQFLFSARNSQETVDKVKLLAQRTYTDLEGVTERMGTRMGRILADGLMRGKSAQDLAGEMVDAVGIEERAALRIARTEVVRASAEGQLMALGRLGVKELGVLVEWSADGEACPKCAKMAGRKFPIEKASGLIPLHPHCRCAWTPQVQRMAGRGKLKNAKRLTTKKRKAAKR